MLFCLVCIKFAYGAVKSDAFTLDQAMPFAHLKPPLGLH